MEDNYQFVDCGSSRLTANGLPLLYFLVFGKSLAFSQGVCCKLHPRFTPNVSVLPPPLFGFAYQAAWLV